MNNVKCLSTVSKQQINISNPLNQTLLKCKVMFGYAMLFGFLINILMLATPLYSMQVLDRVISSSNTDTLVFLTLVIVFSLILLSILTAARGFAMNSMGGWFEHQLSEAMFKNAVRASLISKAAGGSQQLRDLQGIKTFLTGPALLSMLDIPWALIFVIVLFIIHPYMGIMTVIGGIILAAFAFLSDKYTKPLHDQSSESFISSMRTVDQATRNAEVIQVMGLMPNIIKSWQKLNHRVQDAQGLVSARQSVFAESTKFIRYLLQILTTGLGAYLVLKNEMSVGAIIACSSISGRALAPFEQAITSWKSLLSAQQSYKRLNTSLDKFYTTEVRMSLPTPLGRITAENIFFAPAGSQKQILKNINFDIAPGESIAIIGPSGSGKTTLAKLISGAWIPNMGSMRIDGSNITDWNTTELGAHVGYLPQDIELFSGTIKENIGRMNSHADSEKVIDAAQAAGVHELIIQLPKGYDTEIGVDGGMLSGGQRQRIALARAFFGEPKILILDEPNANLDAAGEAALSNALINAKHRGITTIVVSHRTPILAIVDKVMLIKDGMLALFGNKEEVMMKLNASSNIPQHTELPKKEQLN